MEAAFRFATTLEGLSGVLDVAARAFALPTEMNMEEKSKSLVREKVLGLMRLNSTGLLEAQDKNSYRQDILSSWFRDSFR